MVSPLTHTSTSHLSVGALSGQVTCVLWHSPLHVLLYPLSSPLSLLPPPSSVFFPLCYLPPPYTASTDTLETDFCRPSRERYLLPSCRLSHLCLFFLWAPDSFLQSSCKRGVPKSKILRTSKPVETRASRSEETRSSEFELNPWLFQKSQMSPL